MNKVIERSVHNEPKRFILSSGRKLSFHSPLVMGIVNITPDSFYDGGRYFDADTAVKHAEKILDEGADIIDLGACSTRPGARDIGEAEELKRLLPVLETLIKRRPATVISVDTYRAKVAAEAVKRGAAFINDISGGMMDKEMFETAAKLDVPYVLMHIKGTPQTMQKSPVYTDILTEVEQYFTDRIDKLLRAGVNQIIIDPGFGFGKTNEHNYTLLRNLRMFTKFNLPLLAGISRKSMVNRVLGIKPENALTGTITLNTIALLHGANILRVHDVAEAKQLIKLVSYYLNCNSESTTPV